MRAVLKYPGSKWNIASQLVEMIPEHHSYVEPFFGNNNIQPCKGTSPTRRIDGLAGLLDAYVMLENHLEEYLSLI